MVSTNRSMTHGNTATALHEVERANFPAGIHSMYIGEVVNAWKK